MIIDAHAHVFRQMSGKIGRGKVDGIGFGRVLVHNHEIIQLVPPIMKETTFPPDVFLECMTWAGVERAVLLQGPFYGERNTEVADAVRQWPQRFTGGAFVDPWEPEARENFDRVVEQGFRVLKLELSPSFGLSGLHPGLSLNDEQLSWLWTELERLHMVLTLDLGAIGSSSYQTAAVAKLADAHPELKIVIAHMGQPTPIAERDPELWSLWQAQIKLGLHPHVWFDTSALPHRAEHEQYPFPSIGRWVRQAVDLIGPHKLMWGSDAPALLTAANYNQLLILMQHHFEFLSPADRELIFGKTALEVYPF
jgi:predicted TIM-barrel fold metal-dependent hydrolase